MGGIVPARRRAVAVVPSAAAPKEIARRGGMLPHGGLEPPVC